MNKLIGRVRGDDGSIYNCVWAEFHGRYSLGIIKETQNPETVIVFTPDNIGIGLATLESLLNKWQISQLLDSDVVNNSQIYTVANLIKKLQENSTPVTHLDSLVLLRKYDNLCCELAIAKDKKIRESTYSRNRRLKPLEDALAILRTELLRRVEQTAA